MNEEVVRNTHKIYFDSINDFYKYITETPLNESFRWEDLSSSRKGDVSFRGTSSFEEAAELLKNGWTEQTEKLNNILKVEGKFETASACKITQSVEGYHPIVPLYLMGIPTNMVSKKVVPMKQKIVTLNKSINYSAVITKEEIVNESIKAFKLIKKLESQNYKVNLNLVLGVAASSFRNKDTEIYYVKIRLKSANEKLNISKLSFPLIHPSMLRRLCLRFEEVYPTVSRSFICGYGSPLRPEEMRELSKKDEYLLPQFIKKDISKINSLDDLENL